MDKELSNRQIVRIARLKDQGTELDLVDASVEERWAAVWEMTKSAWAFKGEPVDEQGLLRHIEGIRKVRS
jgi:hypothetical protein